MKPEELLCAVSYIGDDLVEQASDALHGKRRIQNLSRKGQLGVIAACLALFVSITALLGQIGKNADITILNTEKNNFSFGFGAMSPMPPSLSWDDSLFAKVKLNKVSFAPGETVTIKISAAMKNDILGPGNLQLVLICDDFTLESSTNNSIVFENFTLQNHPTYSPATVKLELQTLPVEIKSGTLLLSFRFVPADMEIFMQSISQSDLINAQTRGNNIAKDGYVSLASCQIYYGITPAGTSFITSNDSIINRVLISQRQEGKLSKKEYVDLHYRYYYRDHVYISRERYDPETRTFRLEYISKNIRYVSDEMISDDTLWSLFVQQSAFFGPDADILSEESISLNRTIAKEALAYMLRNRIITQEEYDKEVLWIEEAASVAPMQYIIFHDGSWRWPYSMYEYTHKDP